MIWTPPKTRPRILCPRCRKPIQWPTRRAPVRPRYRPWWRTLVPAVNMAVGDRLLDADGNRILDADGNVMLDDDDGNACCCCSCSVVSGTDCTYCPTGKTPLTARIVFSGITPVCAAGARCLVDPPDRGGVIVDGNFTVTATQSSACIWADAQLAAPFDGNPPTVYGECDCTILCTDFCNPVSGSNCDQEEFSVSLLKTGTNTFTLESKTQSERCGNLKVIAVMFSGSVTLSNDDICCGSFVIPNGTRIANSDHTSANPPNAGVGGIATVTWCP